MYSKNLKNNLLRFLKFIFKFINIKINYKNINNFNKIYYLRKYLIFLLIKRINLNIKSKLMSKIKIRLIN